MVLSTGQVFMIFGLLIFALILSTATLLGEICYSKYKNRKNQDLTSKNLFEKMANNNDMVKIGKMHMKKSMTEIKM